MYFFQLDIGSLTTPVIGGGWVDVQPIYNECTITKSKGRDDLQVRKNLSGSFEFKGDDYDALKTLADAGNLYCDLRCYWQHPDEIMYDLVLEGNLSLLGEYHIKKPYVLRGRTCKLEFVQDDLYGKILSHMDQETTIISEPYEIIHDFSTSIEKKGQAYEVLGSGSYNDWTTDNFYNNSQQTPNAWSSGHDYLALQGSGSPPDRLWYGRWADFVYVSGQSYACKGDHTSSATTEPGTGASWTTYWEEVEDPYEWIRISADFEFTDSVWDSVLEKWVKAAASGGSFSFSQFGEKLFDVLEEILGEIDPTIEIYETTSGANTGFCEYTENNFPDSHILFFHNLETEYMVFSLQQIIEIYKFFFNCDWRFEGNIFVFRHPSERPTSVGGTSHYDLTAYKSTDWTIWEQRTEITNKVNRETWKLANNVLPDWDKQEFKYDNNFNESKNNSLSYKTYIDRSLEDDKGFLILAASYGSQWDLSNATGVISGETEYNGTLAPSYLVSNHHLHGRPFAAATYNGSPIVLTKKRNTEIQLRVPYFDPDIIDQENYLIQTNNGNLEVIEINIKLADGEAEITAVK